MEAKVKEEKTYKHPANTIYLGIPSLPLYLIVKKSVCLVSFSIEFFIATEFGRQAFVPEPKKLLWVGL